MLTIARVTGGRELGALRELFSEYARAANAPDCFCGFADEVAGLPAGYDGLFLASDDALAAGCVALRRLPADTAEMKRLYVRPAWRAGGLGRRLAEEVIAAARSARCARVVLDTLPHMHEARALYRSLGFQEIAPYLACPTPRAQCLELRL